jgi:P pilus assembly chaperone PapD
MKIIFALSFLLPCLAWSQVQVFPTHLTLTEEAPSSYLNLRNANNKDQTYKIELIYYSMAKDGSMAQDPKHESKLTEFLKFSPKSISLKAGEKQVVRVMLTSFDELTIGEHHMHVRFVPESEKSETKDAAKKSASSMSLQAKIAVAVPVIVRKGEGKLEPSLAGLKATTDTKDDLSISVQLKNSTPFYLYGDMELIALTEKGETTLDKIIGVGSYIPERAFTKSYSKKEWEEKTGGAKINKIKVSLKANSESAAPFDLSSETEVTKGSQGKKKTPSKRP